MGITSKTLISIILILDSVLGETEYSLYLQKSAFKLLLQTRSFSHLECFKLKCFKFCKRRITKKVSKKANVLTLAG